MSSTAQLALALYPHLHGKGRLTRVHVTGGPGQTGKLASAPHPGSRHYAAG